MIDGQVSEYELDIIATYEDNYVLARRKGKVGIYKRYLNGTLYQIDDDCNEEMAHDGLFTYRVEKHKEEVRILMNERF